MSPWYNGYVPPDGYRMYIHGTRYKLTFLPCGHVWEKFDEENIHRFGEEFDELSYQFMDMPGLRKKMNCPRCGEEVKQLEKSINVESSEIPERQFKAYRIMGWA